MKKLLIVFALFTTTTKAVRAQTFDTTVKNYAVVPLVTTFQPLWTDTTKAYYLNVTIKSDDLNTTSVLHWVLFSRKMKPLQGGDIVLSGDDYAAWTGDNNYPFNYIANKLNISIK